MNTQIGKEDIYYLTTGKNSLHNHSNDNCLRLINFAALRDMIIGSMPFQHRDIHKGTWSLQMDK
jgi:hypothetical protein